ncbi:MAG TPA: adenylate/guanylate cyclase domain-containing protein [Candidatus Dormibacteraeota bacterium]|nr:adenylate/guanylate cyclase domain-containing protein [Candidatus Dormibacteraeota bacterium]
MVHETLSVDELAVDADVDTAYVRRLIELGALQPRSAVEPFSALDARRVEFFRTWEDAGFSVERVLELVRAGQLSESWLEASVATRVERTDSTYSELCAEHRLPLAMLRAIYQALGFAPPKPGDLARAGDAHLVKLVHELMSAGVHAAAILGILRVYAVGLRRIARAESELYETEIEQPLRRTGWTEQQLLDSGAKFMDVTALEKVILDIYRSQREHVWIEHRIAHAELALERAGLHQTMPSPHAICFVDLSGYTRVIEERGDEVAAQLAARLTPVVEEVSRRHGGRPIRWLGDGGMFHFREPVAAVLSGLDMVECVPDSGLPPVHIGIHAGPVIFQDGDVYGMTVNLAARLAAYAPAGHVVVSDEVARRTAHDGVVFESLGELVLKGVSTPMAVHRAKRGPRSAEPQG